MIDAKRRLAPAVYTVLAYAGAACAQATSCLLTDHECVQQEYPQVCFDAESKLRLEPCLTWLREIERSPSTDVRSSAAAIYLTIAPHPPSEVRAELHDRAAELVRGVLDDDPQHPGALLTFASMAETNEERVRRLRDVVAVDPNPRSLESLANAVLDGTPGGALEAASLYERAYESAMSRGTGDYAWRFARNAMWEYERAGTPERADRLRGRVARDYGLAAMVDEAAKPAAADPASLGRILQDLCREMTLTLFGAKPCLASIDHLIAAVDRRPAGEASRLEQIMSAAMLTAARSGSRLDSVDPDWRSRFEAALERHLGAEAATRLRHTESLITIE